MTIDETFNELKDKARDTFIVTLKYKYDFEKNYTIENHILEYDSMSDSYVWLNDWNEGQTDVEVLGYMPLGDVDTTKLEPCDDCVSRQAVIILIDEASEMHPYKVVGDSDTYSNYNQGWSDACDWLYANIEGVPSVTPQKPKTGHWIEHEIKDTCRWLTCSICGYEWINKKENFCPNCGAEMSGGGEDEVGYD